VEKGRERRGGNARIDKGAPAFLALFALDPVLVERDEARVRRSCKLGKVTKHMPEYLVIVSAMHTERGRPA
jgi:hypothetical protein